MDQLSKAEEEQLNKDLKPYLDRAQAFIKLNDAKANVKTLNSILDRLCGTLRTTDELFNKLYNRFIYSGSYYENLRIKSADEFDINIVLKLSAKEFPPFMLEASPESGAFIGYCVDKSKLSTFAGTNGWTKALADLFSNCGEKCWLNMTLVRRWFQHLLAKLPDFTTIDGVMRVEFSESGPAKTLYIYTTSGRIDVDLVPVFEVPYKRWPQLLQTDSSILELIKKKHSKVDDATWCLVPKEHQPRNCPLYWRVHFPYVERDLMGDNGCLKPIVRLLKLLRDSQGLCYISSYALKTLVILRTVEVSDDYWDKKRLGIAFYETLERLRQALLKDGIPYLYSPKVDLLQSCNNTTRTNCAGRITRMLKKVKSNPEVILEYLKVPAASSFSGDMPDTPPRSPPDQLREQLPLAATPTASSTDTTSLLRSETGEDQKTGWFTPETSEVAGPPQCNPLGVAKPMHVPSPGAPKVSAVGRTPADSPHEVGTRSAGAVYLETMAPLLHDTRRTELALQEKRLKVQEKRLKIVMAMFQHSLQVGSSTNPMPVSPTAKNVADISAYLDDEDTVTTFHKERSSTPHSATGQHQRTPAETTVPDIAEQQYPETSPGTNVIELQTHARRPPTRRSGRRRPGPGLERVPLGIVQRQFKEEAARRRRKLDIEERRLHLEEQRLQFEIEMFKAQMDLEREALEERKRRFEYEQQQIDLMKSMLEELQKRK